MIPGTFMSTYICSEHPNERNHSSSSKVTF